MAVVVLCKFYLVHIIVHEKHEQHEKNFFVMIVVLHHKSINERLNTTVRKFFKIVTY
jgi:hypothetical protein